MEHAVDPTILSAIASDLRSRKREKFRNCERDCLAQYLAVRTPSVNIRR
jgi:hypothetical protein